MVNVYLKTVPLGRELIFSQELLVTLPLGYLSDRYGRRTILLWNIVAQTLAYTWAMIVGESSTISGT